MSVCIRRSKTACKDKMTFWHELFLVPFPRELAHGLHMTIGYHGHGRVFVSRDEGRRYFQRLG